MAKDVVKEDQKEVPLADNSDPVKQEGDQLSLFNERNLIKRLLRGPVEEAPAEEATAEEEAAPTRRLYGTDNEIDTSKGFDLADRKWSETEPIRSACLSLLRLTKL